MESRELRAGREQQARHRSGLSPPQEFDRRLPSVFSGQQEARGGAVGLGDDPCPLAALADLAAAENAEDPAGRELVLAGVLGRYFTLITALVAGAEMRRGFRRRPRAVRGIPALPPVVQGRRVGGHQVPNIVF